MNLPGVSKFKIYNITTVSMMILGRHSKLICKLLKVLCKFYSFEMICFIQLFDPLQVLLGMIFSSWTIMLVLIEPEFENLESKIIQPMKCPVFHYTLTLLDMLRTFFSILQRISARLSLPEDWQELDKSFRLQRCQFLR